MKLIDDNSLEIVNDDAIKDLRINLGMYLVLSIQSKFLFRDDIPNSLLL